MSQSKLENDSSDFEEDFDYFGEDDESGKNEVTEEQVKMLKPRLEKITNTSATVIWTSVDYIRHWEVFICSGTNDSQVWFQTLTITQKDLRICPVPNFQYGWREITDASVQTGRTAAENGL